jgi:ElaB/YqjD/DUF883 family membrane-anchored ribosome-binding protein
MAARKPEDTETRGPEEIRADIEETREQLGETVEALTEKADVKHQAKLKVDETKERFSRKAEDAKARVSSASPDQARSAATNAASTARRRPLPFAAGAAFAAGIAIGLLIARRRG